MQIMPQYSELVPRVAVQRADTSEVLESDDNVKSVPYEGRSGVIEASFHKTFGQVESQSMFDSQLATEQTPTQSLRSVAMSTYDNKREERKGYSSPYKQSKLRTASKKLDALSAISSSQKGKSSTASKQPAKKTQK